MKEIKGKCSLGWDEIIATLIHTPEEQEAFVKSQRYPISITYSKEHRGDSPPDFPYIIVAEYSDEAETTYLTYITPDMFGYDVLKVRAVLTKLEAELRACAATDLGVWGRERDHQMKAEFLKMADMAKEALELN